MSIDTRKEELIPLSKAVRLLPRFGRDKHPHPSTLWRWHKKGLDGAKLECVRVGKRLCTSVEALDRFLNRCSDTQDNADLTEDKSASSPNQVNSDFAAVTARLAKEGI